MEDFEKYMLFVNFSEYEMKKEMCEHCIHYYECMGPSVFDTSCPRNFNFEMYGEE